MIWILPLIALIGCEILADVLAEEYAVHGHWFWIVSLLCYVIGNGFWLYAIRHGSGLARGADIFAVSTALSATFIGVYFFHESLRGLQWIGIAFGFVALVLIFWGK